MNPNQQMQRQMPNNMPIQPMMGQMRPMMDQMQPMMGQSKRMMQSIARRLAQRRKRRE